MKADTKVTTLRTAVNPTSAQVANRSPEATSFDRRACSTWDQASLACNIARASRLLPPVSGWFALICWTMSAKGSGSGSISGSMVYLIRRRLA
jgi:hypothetical protein